ncbi:MAG: SLC26A/SulP transporter family protein [Hydrogenophilales bacterium]|nr:SLC26A/SulP transporter family protein [Hydrogenophilales bacterium]
MNGGLFVALGLFASDIGYGYIAYAPLGHDYANTGIIAAFLASMLGSLIPAFIRGSAPMFGGPRPAQTLIFAALLGTVAASSSQNSALLVPVAAMACVSLAGMIQIAFGLLGLGRIIRFTPVPVLAGFTNGVALSMILSALLIILDAENASAWLTFDSNIPARLAFVALLLLWMFWLYRRMPSVHWSLTGRLFGAGLHAGLMSWVPGVSLGEMLPPLTSLQPASGITALNMHGLPAIDWIAVLKLVIAPALSLATLNSLEALVIANKQDNNDNSRHDDKRMLLGQGLANIACGVLGALPSAPSNSRQLVAKQMGGDGWSASIAFAVAMLVVLLVMPALSGYIPKIAVAALLIYMALSIFDPWAKNQIQAWWRREGDAGFRHQLRSNIAVMLVVMSIAVLTNLVAAMATGVLLSMVLFVRMNSRSIVARVYFGEKRHSTVMRPLAHVEFLKSQGKRIALVELFGPLFFGSGEILMDEVEALAKHARHIVLDFRQIGTIDASGAGTLQRIAKRLRQRNVRLALASISPGGSHGRLIIESNAQSAIPLDQWFDDPDIALAAAEDALIEESRIGDTASTGRTLKLDALVGLDDAQIGTFLDYTDEVVLANGDVLFRRDDPGDAMYILLAGQIEIRVPVKGGGSRRLIALRAGTLFGEMAILRGAPRSADAVATAGHTELLRLAQEALWRLHREHPDIALSLMRNIGVQLAARLASSTEALRYALVSSRE